MRNYIYVYSKILFPHLKTICKQNNDKWSPEKIHATGQIKQEPLQQQGEFNI